MMTMKQTTEHDALFSAVCYATHTMIVLLFASIVIMACS